MTDTWRHNYVSTACEHAIGEGRPSLHAACRLSCKFGEDGVESCGCGCHTGTPLDEMPPPWVDQSRGLAHLMLSIIREAGIDDSRAQELEVRIETDPHLFWLRDGEQPPGEWRPSAPESDAGGPHADS